MGIGALALIFSCKARQFNNDAKVQLAGTSATLLPNDQLDVNDVSILFPMPRNKTEFLRTLSLADKGSTGLEELMPRTMFPKIKENLTKNSASSSDGGSQNFADVIYERWRIAGMRFEPCVGKVDFDEKDLTCRPQIRLTVALVGFSKDQSSGNEVLKIADQSLHLLYEPVEKSPDEKLRIRQEMVDDLVSLKARFSGIDKKQPTLGYPLVVHPAFEGKFDNDFAKEVKAFILKYCGKKRLIAVAQMATISDAVWHFIGMVVKDDNLVEVDIPNLKQKSKFQNVSALGRIGIRGSHPNSLQDAVVDRLNVNHRTNVDVIHNPTKTSLANMDCVSCHEAQRTEVGLNEAGISKSVHAFVAPAGTTIRSTIGLKDVWSVHNFNWFASNETGPSISPRAINESALVAFAINKNIIHRTPEQLKQNYKPQKYCYPAEKGLPLFSLPTRLNVSGQIFQITPAIGQFFETAPSVIAENAEVKKQFESSFANESPDFFTIRDIKTGEKSTLLAKFPFVGFDKNIKISGFWIDRKEDPQDVLEYDLKFDCDKFIGTAKSIKTGKTLSVALEVF